MARKVWLREVVAQYDRKLEEYRELEATALEDGDETRAEFVRALIDTTVRRRALALSRGDQP